MLKDRAYLEILGKTNWAGRTASLLRPVWLVVEKDPGIAGRTRPRNSLVSHWAPEEERD